MNIHMDNGSQNRNGVGSHKPVKTSEWVSDLPEIELHAVERVSDRGLQKEPFRGKKHPRFDLVRGEIFRLFAVILMTAVAFLFFGATPPKAAVSSVYISYLAVFFIASLAFMLVRTIEQMLKKAGLIKSDTERYVEDIHSWIFAEDSKGDAKCAKQQMIDLYDWHSPINIEGGLLFPWKIGSQVSRDLEQAINLLNDLSVAKNRETEAMLALKGSLDDFLKEQEFQKRLEEEMKKTGTHPKVGGSGQ